MCRDHHRHSVLFPDSTWIHNEKYHPCPRWFVLSLTTLLPSVQHNLFAFCVNLEVTATQQLIFLTSEVLPSLFVKNVVRISPPLNNSWYHNTSCHLRSFLGPRIVFNRNTDNGAMTCEFKTSNNPIALKLMVDRSFLDYWLLNHHSGIGRATQPIFPVHLSSNV